jgi:hypothetical protein
VLQKALETLRGESPEVPGMLVDRKEHDRGDREQPSRLQHPVHLGHRANGIGDVLQGLETQDGPDAVVVERERVDVLDAVDARTGLDVAPDMPFGAEHRPHVGDVLLSFRGARADLHDRLGDLEVLGNITREAQSAISHRRRTSRQTLSGAYSRTSSPLLVERESCATANAT